MVFNMTFFYSTSTLLIWLCSFALHAQIASDTIKYDLFVDDDIIGDFIIVKNVQKDSSIQYSGLSNVNYKILFSFHISFDYQTNFNSQGMYSSSSFKYVMNDDVKEANWIRCSTQECYVYEDDEVSKIITAPSNMTAMQLYFQEPKNGDHVFSERFCDSYPVELEGLAYKIDFPGGSTNKYYYKNGLCYQIEIDTLISKMVFKLRDHSVLLTEK
jgi:hypothetical protein